MSKTVKKVFIVIGALVMCLLVWSVFFGNKENSGILVTAYNGIAKGVNGVWENISGSDDKLIPEWEISSNTNAEDAKGSYGSKS